MTKSAEILKTKKDKIFINLMEIEPSWAMEGGYVVPSVGEDEKAWLEKVKEELNL